MLFARPTARAVGKEIPLNRGPRQSSSSLPNGGLPPRRGLAKPGRPNKPEPRPGPEGRGRANSIPKVQAEVCKKKKGRNTRSCLRRTQNFQPGYRLGEFPANQPEAQE